MIYKLQDIPEEETSEEKEPTEKDLERIEETSPTEVEETSTSPSEDI